jgi:hypothetical protein
MFTPKETIMSSYTPRGQRSDWSLRDVRAEQARGVYADPRDRAAIPPLARTTEELCAAHGWKIERTA